MYIYKIFFGKYTFMRKLLFISGLLLTIHNYGQKLETLALTPPMGWNTFNTFAGNFNEKLIREMADILVSSGMKDAGYKYIIIDDNWTAKRDSLGFLTVDKSRFPSGMEAMSAYIHSKGLKLGLYSDAGYKTCGGYTASRGHEFQDAIMFAHWGADYLKYDWCETEGLKAIGAYTTMRDAIFATKRPMVFSLCEWGDNKPWEWASGIGHLWRTTGDICNCWSCTENYGTYKKYGVTVILDMQDGLRKYAGPGHWNDPDMLEVGNCKLTPGENRAHFSIWSMIAAPLIAGNDLRKMTKETLDVLTNREVIAIDQDSLGIQGFKQDKIDSLEIWYKPLKHGDWALCFFNRGSKPANIEYDWQKQVITDEVAKLTLRFDQKPFIIRDLWLKKTIGQTNKILKTNVPAHDVLMLRLIKQ
jgi:alpha-galactosidase